MAFNHKLQKARQALLAEKNQLAAKLYQSLLAEFPDAVVALIESARAFTLVGDVHAARESLNRAKDLEPSNLEIQLHVASGFFKLTDYAHAYTLLKSICQKSKPVNAVIALVEVCERLGYIDEALQLINDLPSKPPRILLLKAEIASRQGNFSEAIQDINTVLTTANLDSATKLRGGLLLARSHDKLGNYELAWKTMTEAHSDSQPVKNIFSKLQKSYQSEIQKLNISWNSIIDEHQMTHSNESHPTLITGHPRSGTSMIAAHLSEQESAINLDEIGAFARTLDRAKLTAKPPQRLKNYGIELLQQEYRTQMTSFVPDAIEQNIWFDKNPGLERQGHLWLTVFPNSEVKLIQRNAFDCLISCLFTYLPLNPYSLQFKTPSLAAESIQKSLEFQAKLQQFAPQNVEIIEYEQYLEQHLGKLVVTNEAQAHSPNYSTMNKEIHKKSVNRYENYEKFMPLAISNIIKEL